MNRCVLLDSKPSDFSRIARRAALRRLAGVGAAVLIGWAAPAQAGLRQFPMNTKRGQITFINSAQVMLNGKTERLGPGTRIHDALSNRLVFANTLQGQSFTVNYVFDGAGTIREIWILTPDEIQQPLPPTQDELNRIRQSQDIVPPRMLN